LLALLASLPVPLRAQAPSRLLGRVVDATTGAPLPGAEVRLGDRMVMTAGDGAFVLGSLPPGRTSISVRRLGYIPWADVLDVVPGLDRTVAIELAPLPLQLDSLTVVAAPGTISISGEELQARGADLGHALDGWEGVAVRRTGSGGPASPQLRGGGPDEVLVLVDGFSVNDPFTGRADLGRIASREVDHLTLLPGAQTVRAGARAVAGVIVVDTRRPIGPDGSAWVANRGARGLRLGASAGPIGVIASGERYAERFPYTVPDVRGGGEGVRLNAGGDLYTLSARLDGSAQVSLRASQSDRGLPGTTSNPTLAAEAHDRSILVGARGTGALRWSGSMQWIETRAEDPSPPTGPAYDSYTHGLGGTAEVGYGTTLGIGAWTGEGGIALAGGADRFAGDGVQDDASFSHAALRLDASLHRGTTAVWTLSPAFRLDVWTGQTAPLPSARLDAAWQRGRTAISAAIGSAVTPPVLADLLFREGVGVRLNPDLRPERVRWEAEAGVRKELEKATVSARLFYGRVGDMVVWAPDFRFIWSPRNFDVLRRGGEITVGVRPGRTVRADGTATYSAVTYDIPGGSQVQYRPRVTYAATLLWSPSPWAVDLRWHRIGERFPNAAGTNPRPAFSLLDIGVERRLGDALSARVQLTDATDVRAEFIAGYPTPGRMITATLNFQLP
jgi:hypothetical protein